MEALGLPSGKHAVEHSLSADGGRWAVPVTVCQCQMEGKGGREANTSPEHWKHISEMSALGISAYTRTVSGPLSTNRLRNGRGIHSSSDGKR